MYYRGAECIAIVHPQNKQLEDVVRRVRGCKWSQAQGCWYLPLSRES